MEENITRITLSPEEKVENPATEQEVVVAAQEVETPEVEQEAKEPQEVAETPEVAPEPVPIDYDSIAREYVGMTKEEVENLKKEYESIKARPTLDDAELLPDDDFLKDFIKTYKRNGDVTAYLEAMTTDFTKMSDEEVVKYEIRKANPGMSDRLVEKKFKERLSSFGFKEEYDDPQEEADAKEYLRYEAQVKRAGFIEQSKKFAIPERKEPVVELPDVEAQIAHFENIVRTDPATLGMQKDKKIAFGDFQYQVNPDELRVFAVDSNKFFQLFNKDGVADLDKFYKVAAFAKDHEGFLAARDAHVIAKAKIEWMKELKNPSTEPKPSAPTGKVSVRIV